jgi:hypothetical protein
MRMKAVFSTWTFSAPTRSRQCGPGVLVLAALNDDPDAGDRTLAEFGDCVHCLRNMIMSIFALTLADQLANQAGRERAVAIIEKLIADQMKG